MEYNLHGPVSFQVKKVIKQQSEIFRNEFNRNRIIYYSKSVFKFKKLKYHRERNFLVINLIGIGLYITQNQFSS